MPDSGALKVSALGPLRVVDDLGRDLTPEGALQRRLLALLILNRGRVVSTDTAIEVLWPRRRPGDTAAALQTHIFRLRKGLPEGFLVSVGPGYSVDPSFVDLDADRLSMALNESRRLRPTSPERAAAVLDDALAGWRATPYPELADFDEAAREAERLVEVRASVREERADALLEIGGTPELLGEIVALVDEHPLGERPRRILMEALVSDGRAPEALRVYDDFRRLLGAEMGIEPSPELTGLHAAMLRGQATPSRRGPRYRLPLPTTSLVGRDALVVDMVELTRTHRLVTMLGPGGVGKTRLLMEVGHRLSVEDPDRPVVWCELASATPATAHDAIATALGIDRRPDVVPLERIVTVLDDAPIVLLLDNCEHVLEPIAEFVDQVLARCPGAAMLATTRERLRVSGEQLCPVPPLPLIGHGPAQQLFVDRAAAVKPGFVPSASDLVAIDEIVRRLDGLPLAIELAAARLHTLQVDEVATGLDRRFRLLGSGPRNSVRHRSLAAAVTWSFDLLDGELRRVFADLSVFVGAFTVADVAAVADLELGAAADALDALTERSLVIRAPGGGGYMLLETLRAFGAERLLLDGRAESVAARHADYQVGWAEDANRRMRLPGGETVLGEIDAAVPELRSALAWLLTRGHVESAARLVAALADYGFLRLRPDILMWSDQVIAADPHDSTRVAADVWATSALGVWTLGDVHATGIRAARAYELAEGSVAGPSPLVLDVVGAHALFEGDLTTAVDWFRRAKAAGVDDPGWTLMVSGLEAMALAYAGHPDTGPVADALGELLDNAGDATIPHAAFAWYCAGEADLGLDIPRARARLTRALELAEITGASFVTGVAGTSLVSLEARLGDAMLAAGEYRRLIAHWRRAGMWSTQWTMLRSICSLLARLERWHDSAVLVGAVTTTASGHRLFGDDEIAMAALGAELRGVLGESAFEEAVAKGARLDGDAAVEHALSAL